MYPGVRLRCQAFPALGVWSGRMKEVGTICSSAWCDPEGNGRFATIVIQSLLRLTAQHIGYLCCMYLFCGFGGPILYHEVLLDSLCERVLLEKSVGNSQFPSWQLGEDITKTKQILVRWGERELLKPIREMIGISQVTEPIRIWGEFYPDHKAIIYDLNDVQSSARFSDDTSTYKYWEANCQIALQLRHVSIPMFVPIQQVIIFVGQAEYSKRKPSNAWNTYTLTNLI